MSEVRLLFTNFWFGVGLNDKIYDVLVWMSFGDLAHGFGKYHFIDSTSDANKYESFHFARKSFPFRMVMQTPDIFIKKYIYPSSFFSFFLEAESLYFYV